MIGFHITVPGMSKDALIAFVEENIPPQKELLRRARLKRLAARCRDTGVSIEDLCSRYSSIPTVDSTLTFPSVGESGDFQVMQLSSGGDEVRDMRDGLCEIVHKHLIRILKKKGIKYTANVF